MDTIYDVANIIARMRAEWIGRVIQEIAKEPNTEISNPEEAKRYLSRHGIELKEFQTDGLTETAIIHRGAPYSSWKMRFVDGKVVVTEGHRPPDVKFELFRLT